MIFQQQKYQVVKNAISYELANFIFNYFLLKRDAIGWLYKNNITYDTGLLGTWTDKQVPNTFSCWHYLLHSRSWIHYLKSSRIR